MWTSKMQEHPQKNGWLQFRMKRRILEKEKKKKKNWSHL